MKENYIVIPVSEKTRLIYHDDRSQRGYFPDRLLLQNYQDVGGWVNITKNNLENWNSIGFNPQELPQIIEALQRLEKLLVLK
jgi:hypothetical protein